MPELPDIAVYIDALAERVGGQVLEKIRISSPFVVRSYDPPMRALEGRRVEGFRRIGKRICFELEDEHFLVVHLMVAGRFRFKPRGAKVPGRMGLAAFDFPDATLILTEASKKKRASLHAVRGETALAELDPGGIEVLGCSLADFHAALTQRNHTLKRMLTDPHVFSGIGNAYSDEILHRAQLSPVKWTQRLSSEEIARLHDCTQAVLTWWVEHLRQERGDDFPEKVTAFRPEMAVHGKYREPCPTCGTPVQRIVRGESEINYCPTCQTKGKLLADRALSRLLKGDWPKTLEELEERKASHRSGVDGAKTGATKPVKAPVKAGVKTGVKKAAKKAATAARKKAASKRGPMAALEERRARARTRPSSPLAKRSKKPLVLFAHGAGAPSSSEWMRGWAKRLGSIGHVETFDYPYMREGRARPDRQDKLIAAHGEALAEARSKHRGPIILVGKSMGGRMGCHLSLETPVRGLVCLGYPLVSPGKQAKLRDEVLLALDTPILFVQGTRDRLCPLDTLAEVRARMKAQSELYVVDSGDHSLLATKTWLKQKGLTQADVDAAILAAIDVFVASL